MLKEMWNKKEIVRLSVMLFIALLVAFIPPESGHAGDVGKQAVDSLQYYRINTIQYWNLMQEKLKSE